MQLRKNEQPEIVTAILEKLAQEQEQPAIMDLDFDGNVTSQCTREQFAIKIQAYALQITETLPAVPQSFIGINIPKGMDYYACIIAIWQSGHVYVPLPVDQTDLYDRAQRVAVDAVITDNTDNWCNFFPFDESKKCNIDRYEIIFRRQPFEHAKPESNKIAYIINTSGSTGEPKSIVIGHAGILNMAQSSIELMKIAPDSRHRLLQRSPLVADPSLFELLIGLLSGSVIYSFQESKQRAEAIDQLPEIVLKHQITILLCPPNRLETYKKLADENDAYREFVKPIQRLLSTTDKVSSETLAYYATNIEGVFDGYGPTETTVGLMIKDANVYPGTLGHIHDNTFKGMELLVVHENQPINYGIGELCATGPGLMIGHCRQGVVVPLEDLPEYVFNAGQKIFYRTGDLIELTQDHTIVYKKRINEKKVSGMKALSIPVIRQKFVDQLNDENIAILFSEKFNGFEIFVAKDSFISPSIIQAVLSENKSWETAVPSKTFMTGKAEIRYINESDQLPEGFCYKQFFQATTNLSDIFGDDDLVTKIELLWSDALQVERAQINPHMTFSQYGGDSTAQVTLLLRIKASLGIELSSWFFNGDTSLYNLIEFIIVVNAWQQSMKFDIFDRNNKTLIYFPPLAGDSYQRFPELKKSIGRQLNHLIFCCPLTDDMHSSLAYQKVIQRQCQLSHVPIELTARALANIILTSLGKDAVRLIGYSFGGLLTIATANILYDIGIGIEYLGLIDAQAPMMQAKLPLAVHKQRAANAVQKIMDTEKAMSIRDHQAKYTQMLVKLEGNNHRDVIHHLMRPLLAGINQDAITVDEEVREPLQSLSHKLLTSYYHFMQSIDYCPDPMLIALPNVHCYLARLEHDQGLHQTQESDWHPYCQDYFCHSIEFPEQNHSTMLADNSPVLIAIAKDVQTNLSPKLDFDGLIGLPVEFEHFTGRRTEIEKLRNNIGTMRVVTNRSQRSQSDRSSQVTQQIFGSGGIGKSQLVNFFARSMYAEGRYPWVFWLQVGDTIISNREAIINEQFMDIGARLGINVSANKGLRLVELVYKTLYKKYGAGLVVFDDVSGYDSIKSYLPSAYNILGFDVIITSRNSEVWDVGIKPIELGIFSHEDALFYIKTVLEKFEPDLYDAVQAARLADLFGYYPLALSQALAFIVNTGGETLDSYCDMFLKKRSDAKELLQKLPFASDGHQETVWMTVQLALEKINDQNARMVLKVASYLAAESPIEKPLLENWTDGRLSCLEALKKLEKFGLISEGNLGNYVQMHQMVQTIMCLHDDPEEQEIWLQQVATFIDKHYDQDASIAVSENRGKYLLPHMLKVSERLKSYQNSEELLTLFANLQLNIGIVLLQLGQEAQAIVAQDTAISGYIQASKILPEAERTGLDPNILIAQAQLALATERVGRSKEAIEILGDIYNSVKAQDERRYHQEHFQTAMLLNTAGMANLHLGKPDKTEEYLTRALQIFDAIGFEDEFTKASIRMNLGLAYLRRGYPARALVELNEAFPIIKSAFGTDEHPVVATCLNNLSVAMIDCGNAKQANELLQKARPVIKRAYTENHAMAGLVGQNQGLSLIKLGASQSALQIMSENLATLENSYGKHHYDTIIARINLASTYLSIGKYKKAIKVADETLDIINEAIELGTGADLRHLWGQAKNTLGLALQEQGKHEAAIGNLKDALENIKAKLPEDHPEVSICRMNLAVCEMRLGNYDVTIEILKEVYNNLCSAYRPDHTDVARCLMNLAVAKSNKGLYKEAEEHFARAQEIIGAELGEYTYEYADILHNIAIRQKEKGENEQAKATLMRVLDIFSVVFGVQHVKNASIYKTLGDIECRLKHFDEAETFYRKSLECYEQENGPINETTATAYDVLAYFLAGQKRVHEASGLLDLALDGFQGSYSNKPKQLAGAYSSLAVTYAHMKQIDVAVLFYQKSQEIYIKEFGECHEKVATVAKNLGDLYFNNAEPLKFKEQFERAILIFRTLDPPVPLKLANCLNQYGMLLTTMRNPEIAIQCYSEAIDLHSAHSNGLDDSLTMYRMNRAVCRRMLGDIQGAIGDLNEVIADRKQLLGIDDDDATCLVHLADCFSDMNQPEEALNYLRRALPKLTAQYGEEHSRVAKCNRRIANAIVKSVRRAPDLALKYFDNAISTETKVYGEDHIETTYSKWGKAIALVQLERKIEAFALFKEVDIVFKKYYDEKHADRALLTMQFEESIRYFLEETNRNPNAFCQFTQYSDSSQHILASAMMLHNMPLSVEVAINIATILYHLGLHQPAVFILEMTVAAEPNNKLAAVLKFRCDLACWRLENIEQRMVELMERFDDPALFDALMMQVMQVNEKYLKLDHLATELSPNWQQASSQQQLEFVRILRKVGRMDMALIVIEDILQRNPTKDFLCRLLYEQAYCYLLRANENASDLQAALVAIKECGKIATRECPEQKSQKLLDRIALCLTVQNKVQEWMPTLEISANPGSAAQAPNDRGGCTIS